MRIPDTLLIAPCPFGAKLPGARVGEAIAEGVRAAGMPAPDVCPIEDPLRGSALGRALAEMGFDARMRRARAVVVAAWRLDRDTLPQSAAFEIATRARQAGVPAYAVAGKSGLDAFDARLLDLQLILEAQNARGLSAAGLELARLT
ncbi:MAG TPA: glycerate kinase [Solirubrobacteraceae bacterium]|nr:glycerate kinase [Solirubrobacteraceae bacterium]